MRLDRRGSSGFSCFGEVEGEGATRGVGAARGGGADGSGARRERLPDLAWGSCTGLAEPSVRGVKAVVPVVRRRDDEDAGAAWSRRAPDGAACSRRGLADAKGSGVVGAGTAGAAFFGGGLPCDARHARDVAGFAGSVDGAFVGSLSLGRSIFFLAMVASAVRIVADVVALRLQRHGPVLRDIGAL